MNLSRFFFPQHTYPRQIWSNGARRNRGRAHLWFKSRMSRNFKGALFILCPVFLNAVVFSDCAQEVSLCGKTLKKCF